MRKKSLRRSKRSIPSFRIVITQALSELVALPEIAEALGDHLRTCERRTEVNRKCEDGDIKFVSRWQSSDDIHFKITTDHQKRTVVASLLEECRS